MTLIIIKIAEDALNKLDSTMDDVQNSFTELPQQPSRVETDYGMIENRLTAFEFDTNQLGATIREISVNVQNSMLHYQSLQSEIFAIHTRLNSMQNRRLSESNNHDFLLSGAALPFVSAHDQIPPVLPDSGGDILCHPIEVAVIQSPDQKILPDDNSNGTSLFDKAVDDDVKEIPSVSPVRKGSKVKLVSGPFTGREGVVREVNQDSREVTPSVAENKTTADGVCAVAVDLQYLVHLIRGR